MDWQLPKHNAASKRQQQNGPQGMANEVQAGGSTGASGFATGSHHRVWSCHSSRAVTGHESLRTCTVASTTSRMVPTKWSMGLMQQMDSPVTFTSIEPLSSGAACDSKLPLCLLKRTPDWVLATGFVDMAERTDHSPRQTPLHSRRVMPA